ncbi:hypothetical protein WH47_08646 [Habropoda laboriosa]|uniref:Uncharacterized protein n=1 Tax=Habropoda laboriosa TaxID=597456 RepID=A0A0L7RH84_9HYME|nr:hypothetical protein WH47_08646 [Habropoda laboriosa]
MKNAVHSKSMTILTTYIPSRFLRMMVCLVALLIKENLSSSIVFFSLGRHHDGSPLSIPSTIPVPKAPPTLVANLFVQLISSVFQGECKKPLDVVPHIRQGMDNYWISSPINTTKYACNEARHAQSYCEHVKRMPLTTLSLA